MSRPSDETLRLRRSSVYVLRLLAPNGRPANPGLPGVTNGEFRFEYAPQRVEYQDGLRAQVVPQGATGALADVQGISPPAITVNFTFGEAGRLPTGGLDGRELHAAIEGVVRWYVTRVAAEGRARQALHTLEWHDPYKAQHWVVIPMNTPYGARDATGPYKESATLKLQALTRADQGAPAAPLIRFALANPVSACPYAPNCGQGGPRCAGCLLTGTELA